MKIILLLAMVVVAPEPVLQIRPTLYEVRKGTTKAVSTEIIHARGLWDHDNLWITPELYVDALFDARTGEYLIGNLGG